MAEQRKNGDTDRTANPSAPKRAQVSGEASQSPNDAWSEGSEASRGVGILAQRKRQYLIAVRRLPGFAASPADAIHETLRQMEDVEILRRLRPKGFKALGGGVHVGVQEIIVVRMDERRAEALRQSAPPDVVIEEDGRLETGQATLLTPSATPWSNRAAASPRRRQEIRFRILGNGDQPLAGAGVTVFGRRFEAQAIADSSGMASVAIFDAEADLSDINALYVQPNADHWECFVQRPVLDPTEANVVKLNALSSPPAADAGKSGEKRFAWGQKAMNLDRLVAGLTGADVKIGLIDSGCDNRHPLLRHVTLGADMTRGAGAKDWTRDETGQGTHCAGVIAGAGNAMLGVSGIAPGAELHVFKLSPGGRFSDLIEALDQCIERHIDIVHLGLCSDQVSELVAQKIIEARLSGVACVAASGDEGGPAQFPGAVPGVLCVSAIGRLSEFPTETHHALTAIPESIGSAGIFATNFSGSGPQVGVCAPGVAVISSVPGGGLAARDGGAIAAAHVVGFAALVLAHHPLFRGVYGNRGEQRVNALFELVRGSAVRPVFDPIRVGAGLPDFQHVAGMDALNVDAWRAAQNFGAFAGAKDGFGERFSSAGVPPIHLPGAMALMQLRAIGLI